jgi:drug/metabolite transporter (DMT)-like permease
MHKGRSAADICGFLSLLCWLPYLTMALARGRLHFPDSMAAMVIWMICAGPFLGTPLALIAATTRRWWWLVLAAVSLVVLAYGLWDQSRHPFDL